MTAFLRITLALCFWAQTADLACLIELGHDECHSHEEGAGHDQEAPERESGSAACTGTCTGHVSLARAEARPLALPLSPSSTPAVGFVLLPLPLAQDIFHPPA